MVSALDLLHLAQRAAARAAEYLRSVERPSDPARWALKGSRDFVTEVDRTAERLIGDILLAAEPGSRMVGEEFSPDVVTRGLVWIVDPLDGTTTSCTGFPVCRIGCGIKVSSIGDPAYALIATAFPFREVSRLDDYLEQFAGLRVPRAASGARGPQPT